MADLNYVIDPVTHTVTVEVDSNRIVIPPTDTTLTVSGKAADAKATGDAISEVADEVATKANSSDVSNHGLYSCVSVSTLPTSGGNMSFSVSGAGITVGDITIPTYAKGHIVSTGQGGQDAALYAIDYNGNLYTAFRNGTSWGNGTMYSPIVYQEVTNTLSWQAGIHGQNFGTYTKQGYKLCGVMPVALSRSSTTLFAFNHNPNNGNVYMTTNSTYNESNVEEKLLLMWRKA